MRYFAIMGVLAVSVATVRGDVVSSEFNSFPTEEGWQLMQQYCGPNTWTESGFHFQQLDFDECGPPPPPGGAQEDWARSIDEFNGASSFFYEFRVQTDGPGSEIPGGAPTVLAAGNGYGINYHATVAVDQVKLFRDALLPELWFDLQPDIAHTVRVELRNGETHTYRWYVDNVLVDEGEAEGLYPSHDARIAWRGKANWHPCFNEWSYIRYGTIPSDGSGDYDSDGDVDSDDLYFFQDYFSGPAVDAGPGARWADFDFDTDVDCDDWEAFQLAWTDPGDPPPLAPCDLNPIPAVSHWGVVLMTLLLLTAGTIAFRRVPQPSA